MRRIVLFIVSLWLIASQVAVAAGVGADEPQSVGLVLSGGGAKGIAHVGVIQALEEADIPIDYIAGTSMGAIIGSLYACGFTPAEMMELLTSAEFNDWAQGVVNNELTYYFLREQPLPVMLNLTLGDSTLMQSILPSSLINPLPMNFAFMELYAPYTAQCGGNFNNLYVPFRCVASDVTNKRMKVWRSGALGDAVRSSMSFPLVFHPIERGGALLYDGGIYDNFPVDVMRSDFAPQIMIGVDVASTEVKSQNPNMMDQLETMIIQHSDSSLPEDAGIKLRIHLEDFGLLDFEKAPQIYRRGYDFAMAHIDSIKARIHARIPAETRRLTRQVFKSATPALKFGKVTVTGGSPSQNQYVEHLFNTQSADTFGLDHARNAYYRAITPGKFRNLEIVADYDADSELFDLNLTSRLKKNVSVGIGGYLSTATTSQLFISGGYRTLSFNSLDLRLNGWIGQSYLAGELSGQIKLLRSVPSAITLDVVASRRKYFPKNSFFFRRSLSNDLTTDEYFGRIGYAVAAGRPGRVAIEVGGGHRGDGYDNGSEMIDLSQNLATARLIYTLNTLNQSGSPTAGRLVEAQLSAVLGQCYLNSDRLQSRERLHRRWWQADARWEEYVRLSSSWSLGLNARALYSGRQLLSEYIAAVIDAPAWEPSPTYSNLLIPDLRANGFATIGVEPVWMLGSMIQLRAQGSMMLPARRILCDPSGRAYYGDWLSHPVWFGGIKAVAALPFADISVYTNYLSAKGGRWNFGLSLGLFIQAPKFL
ncbi:MAG: patatin-like phospholipase family protein [Paramuribaculum sp.]|nr:patatin-like phospholipase family protein [Paramuribaculum sp.]